MVKRIFRRAFLFLLGIVIVQLLADYFSFHQNRESFLKLVEEVRQKLMAYLDKQPTANNSPNLDNVPNNPAPKPVKSTTETAPKVNNAQPVIETPIQTPPKASIDKPVASKTSVVGKPIEVSRKTINGVPFYQIIVDLTDPDTFITIGLAKGGTKANSAESTIGDETFEAMVSRSKAAVVINGTFFSKDEQKRVMGNMVAEGRFLKYSRWENYGTTLGIREGNQLEMITARVEGQPDWDQHWFSITCGPRLVKQGQIWLAPKTEGFSDPHVFDKGWRTAMGFPQQGNKIYLVSFLDILSLEQEAELMKAMGCYEAMNLDGGASKALAHRGKILVPAGRPLTNVIAVYDRLNPAPESLKHSWLNFQQGERPRI